MDGCFRCLPSWQSFGCTGIRSFGSMKVQRPCRRFGGLRSSRPPETVVRVTSKQEGLTEDNLGGPSPGRWRLRLVGSSMDDGTWHRGCSYTSQMKWGQMPWGQNALGSNAMGEDAGSCDDEVLSSTAEDPIATSAQTQMNETQTKENRQTEKRHERERKGTNR